MKREERNFLRKLMHVVLSVIIAAGILVLGLSVGREQKITAAEETAVKVEMPKAVSATYDWETNSVQADSAAYVYIVKGKSGNSLKPNSKNVQMTKESGASKSSVKLEDLGIKKAKKEVYLYVCDKAFEANGDSINANLVIKAPAAKKITASIDYTKGPDYEKNPVFGFVKITATDESGKEIKNPTIYWSKEADGKYFDINDETKSKTRKYEDGKQASNGFDSKDLIDMIKNGGIIYIKMIGVSGGDGTAQLPSLPVKVKIAKCPKEPKSIKIDVKKDNIALKNGYDFAYGIMNEKGDVVEWKWFTILPVNKASEVKTVEDSIQYSSCYTPLPKNSAEAGKIGSATVNGETVKTYSYTSCSIKALSLDKLIEIITEDGGKPYEGVYKISVRKSATDKKPSSPSCLIELKVQAEKPLVYTQDNVQGEFLVASTDNLKKNPLYIGTIIPNPGSISGESISGAATDGYAEDFKVITTISGGTIVNTDKDGNDFEFAVVNQKDLEATGTKAIDMTTISWKKLDPAKTKFTDKLKGKYKLMDGTSVSVTIKAESGQVGPDEASTYILVRRAGVKSEPVRASKYIKLYLAKQGKVYSLYSTVDNGARAYKYKIKFVKYSEKESESSTTPAYDWNLAEDVEDVAVWLAPGANKYVSLPNVENAKLFNAKATKNSDTVKYSLEDSDGDGVALEADGEHKDKYKVESSESTSGEIIEYVAVRELANAKIVAEITDSVSGSATAGNKETKTLVTITKGKSNISGDDTVYYVGDEITIKNVSDPTTTRENCIINISEEQDEGIKVENGTTGTHTYEFKINTAAETVITIPFTLTDQSSGNENSGGNGSQGNENTGGEGGNETPEPTRYTVTYVSPMKENLSGNSLSFNISEVKCSGTKITTGAKVDSGAKITVKGTYTYSNGRTRVTEFYINGVKASQSETTDGKGGGTITYSVDITVTKDITLNITELTLFGPTHFA